MNHLHLHIEAGLVFIFSKDIQPHALVFGMVDQALLPADFHVPDGDIKSQL